MMRDDYGTEMEAIEQEFFEADMLQAQYEAEGRAYGERMARSRGLREAGDLAGAAAMCPHGSGYPLASLAAEHNDDPNRGEDGFRCGDCGSRLSGGLCDSDVRVLVPCEVRLH